MVTQLPNEERWEAVEVIDIQGVYQGDVITDNNGNLQYRIQCKFSWSLYPVTIYVYRDNCPNPFNVGSYNALVKRASLLPKHNNASDPDEYMFRHYIVQWESIGQTQRGPTPAPTTAPAPQAPVVAEREPTPMETGASIIAKSRPDIFAGIDPNQMRIMRQATLKCASWMMVPVVVEYDANFDDGPMKLAKATEELSELFLEYVVTGKVYEDIPEDAEDLLNEDPFA